jgi:hypothetical protein
VHHLRGLPRPPIRHRERNSAAPQKTITYPLESRSRPAVIGVHDALETVNTIDRNMQAEKAA